MSSNMENMEALVCQTGRRYAKIYRTAAGHRKDSACSRVALYPVKSCVAPSEAVPKGGERCAPRMTRWLRRARSPIGLPRHGEQPVESLMR